MKKNLVNVFKGEGLTKIKKRVSTFSTSEWVEVVMWFNTLVFLFTFSIYVSEVSGDLTTSSTDTIAALGFLFALFLIGSLVFTVSRRHFASKKNKNEINSMGGV